MALEFSKDQLRALMNDYYGGYKQKKSTDYKKTKYGKVEDGQSYVNDAKYYKNNADWKAIGDELGININSTNDLSQLYNYFDENYIKGNKKEPNKPTGSESGPGAEPPAGMKPGQDGYTYEPTSNYNPGTGTYGNGSQNGMQSNGQPATQYDYSGYDPNQIANQVKKSGQVTTAFYDKSFGINPEVGSQKFGDADLTGNLANGITATQLLDYFNSNDQNTLNDQQKKGTGGIYDKVSALAEAEEPLDLLPLPDAGGPVAKMNIGPATVGNVGNASGIRSKRSKGSKSGFNSLGTSQLNRRNFGTAKSPLTIGGLNI